MKILVNGIEIETEREIDVEIPSFLKDEWISVSDRLPIKLEKVLFHWLAPGNLRNISMGYRCDAGWNIYLPYHSFGLRNDICPITHWMELPQFPKWNFNE